MPLPLRDSEPSSHFDRERSLHVGPQSPRETKRSRVPLPHKTLFALVVVSLIATLIIQQSPQQELTLKSSYYVRQSVSTVQRTFGGCFERFPFIHNGGFRRFNASFVDLLVLPQTDIATLRKNLSTCSTTMPYISDIEL
ncbi:Hypothetical protein, putative [Bodo saltans]|uniref:Uncharacterized protein n=1 Tax=Bodo saltans TaxID=75058 RepID=A0A0S4JHK4_BODSA|nr:Hypothetical protein, putative [Bodo saltans]|eukprot:CUG90973.1 Hypothetical protein, putative [Bodo saltans]